MKVKSVRISNVFSYKTKTPDLGPDILFSTAGASNFSLLIGPNGSGKSNFIEVLNQFFRRGLFIGPIPLNTNLLESSIKGNPSPTAQELRAVLTLPSDDFSVLERSYGDNGPREIKIEMEINDKDRENLKDFLSAGEIINSLFDKFSSFNFRIPVGLSASAIDGISSIEFSIVEIGENKMGLLIPTTPLEKYVTEFFRYFELVKKAVEIHNDYLKIEPKLPELSNTFVLLSSYRNYSNFGESVSINPDMESDLRQTYERNKNLGTKNGDTSEPPAIDLVKKKIGYRFFDTVWKDKKDPDEAKRILQTDKMLERINRRLKEYLGFEIDFDKTNPRSGTVEFYFKNILDNERVTYSGLSSGQKSIVLFLFTVYGFELKNGSVLIDEPELHLHPQIQRKFLEIMEEVALEDNIQVITATHSPVFINQKTISQVFRFTNNKKEGTKIVAPQNRPENAKLVRILEYTNTSKIFFVNNVVLVEGESDEYFFNFFIDQLRKRGHKLSEDFEILNIKGKAKYQEWKDFLESYKIIAHFIGDWDNIFDFNIATLAELQNICDASSSKKAIDEKSVDCSSLLEASKEYISKKDKDSFDNLASISLYLEKRYTDLPKLIQCVKSKDSARSQEIDKRIEEEKQENVYILSLGELENYLGLRISKKLDAVIEFCNSGFETWYANTAFTSHRNEMESIIKSILGK